MPRRPFAKRGAPRPFPRIVCGVDGGRGSREAVDQAITLARPDAALTFVCVRWEEGAGLVRQSTIGRERAEEALREAVRAAAAEGLDAASELRSARGSSETLVDEASRADLLVLGSHGGSRAGGIMIGSTAANAVHRADVPVLVARRPPDAVPFPERILVATDGSPDAQRAVELAGRIGHRFRARVYLLSVDPAPHGRPAETSVDAAELTAALGGEPVVLRQSGEAHERILETAANESVSLIVLGSRGTTGLHALGSVSERVTARANCSVLVARGGG